MNESRRLANIIKTDTPLLLKTKILFQNCSFSNVLRHDAIASYNLDVLVATFPMLHLTVAITIVGLLTLPAYLRLDTSSVSLSVGQLGFRHSFRLIALELCMIVGSLKYW